MACGSIVDSGKAAGEDTDRPTPAGATGLRSGTRGPSPDVGGGRKPLGWVSLPNLALNQTPAHPLLTGSLRAAER